MDFRVLFFTLGATLLTGLLFGTVPALQASNPNLNESLREGGRRGGSVGGGRMRSLLVVTEVAISLALLIGAGLLLRSFMYLLHRDIGVRQEGIVAVSISLPDSKYPEPQQRRAFFDELLARATALPGVEGAELTNMIPLQGGRNGDFYVEGVDYSPDTAPLSERMVVSPGYFRLMGIPLLKGRFFNEQDASDSENVILISHELAEKHFPNTDPIGKRLSYSRNYFQNAYRIVGVVGDVRHWNIAGENPMAAYHPYKQAGLNSMYVVLRTPGDRQNVTRALREQLRRLDPDIPFARVQTMQEVVRGELAQRRVVMSLLGGFAALALLLAAVGIYSVMSYTVAERTHEMGVRMALGADLPSILGLVLSQGARLVAGGLALGLLSAFALNRYLGNQLAGVSPYDPLTVVGVAALLMLVALVACFVPARRASRVDPMVALRYE